MILLLDKIQIIHFSVYERLLYNHFHRTLYVNEIPSYISSLPEVGKNASFTA